VIGRCVTDVLGEEVGEHGLEGGRRVGRLGGGEVAADLVAVLVVARGAQLLERRERAGNVGGRVEMEVLDTEALEVGERHLEA